MKIDSHQHFWKYQPAEYGWMDGEVMAPLRRDFLPPDLEREQARVGLDGSVAVQARQSLEESDWLLQLADRHPVIRGVVGWVDLRSPGASQDLARLAPHPKFVGVRHVAQDEPDDRFLGRPEFVRGVGLLRDHRLTYDILIYPRQLPAAIELVRQCPGQPFVLDHLAKPVIRAAALSPWQDQIRELAGHPHVWCKVSGMVTEAKWKEWRPEDFKPYLDVVFEAFGENRLMFGSDWPVCTLSGSYSSVLRIVEDYLQGCSESVRAKVMGLNAARFYGLEQPGS